VKLHLQCKKFTVILWEIFCGGKNAFCTSSSSSSSSSCVSVVGILTTEESQPV
jgi:hypothetical protein